jgi:hypothetical protein
VALAETGTANATDNTAAATFQYFEATRDVRLMTSPSIVLKSAEIRRTSAEGQSHVGAPVDQCTVRRETEMGQHGQAPVGLAGRVPTGRRHALELGVRQGDSEVPGVVRGVRAGQVRRRRSRVGDVVAQIGLPELPLLFRVMASTLAVWFAQALFARV